MTEVVVRAAEPASPRTKAENDPGEGTGAAPEVASDVTIRSHAAVNSALGIALPAWVAAMPAPLATNRMTERAKPRSHRSNEAFADTMLACDRAVDLDHSSMLSRRIAEASSLDTVRLYGASTGVGNDSEPSSSATMHAGVVTTTPDRAAESRFGDVMASV